MYILTLACIALPRLCDSLAGSANQQRVNALLHEDRYISVLSPDSCDGVCRVVRSIVLQKLVAATGCLLYFDCGWGWNIVR